MVRMTEPWKGHVWKRLKLTATQWVEQVVAPGAFARRRKRRKAKKHV